MIRIINESELDQITGGCCLCLRFPGTEFKAPFEPSILFYQIDPTYLQCNRFGSLIDVAYS